MTALSWTTLIFMGLFTPARGGGLPHKAQQAAPQALYYWLILLTLGVGNYVGASYRHHTRPSCTTPCGHSPGRRQQHYALSANSRPLGWVVVRNPRANPHEQPIPFGQEPRSSASWHPASCHSTRISGPLIPSLSFLYALTKVLPAQVARAARSWATSQMARRVEHAPRRGTVHSSL